MEERLPQIKHAVVAVDRNKFKELAKGKKKLSAEAILIFYSDKSVELVDVSDLDDDKKMEVMDYYDKAIKLSIEDPRKYETLYSDSKDFNKLYLKAEKLAQKQHEDEIEKDNKIGKTALGVGLGALGIAGIVAGTKAAYDLGTKHAENLENNNLEYTNESENENIVPNIEGKDFAFYSENALPTGQKSQIMNISNWLSQNGAESWQKVTLTEEQMKQYNITNPECVFGFTAEEAFALSLRFGNYTNEEYATLTGGNIDVVSIIDSTNSLSNTAISNIISYYVCSDKCDLNIEKIINFNEKEVAKINEIEGMLAEYKELAKNSEKEKEAFAKMQEIKNWFNEYANSVDQEQNNAKSYLLRTVLPACSIISEIHQYEDTVILNVYNKAKDETTTKEVKTALFDEIMMRDLVTGYKDFDEEKFLEEHNISSSKYTLHLTDVKGSIADKYCTDETAKLYQANEFIESLRTENTIAEAAYQGSITINTDENIGDQVVAQMDNVNTKYDELTHGTYQVEELMELLNKNLKDLGIYPQNMNYFRTAKLSEMNIEYNSKHGLTKGKVGDKITAGTTKAKPVTIQDLTAKDAVVLNHAGEVTTPEQATAEARQEEANRTGIPDASTPEASAKADQEAQQNAAIRAAMLQNVYNATYNYFYNGSTQEYDASWATSTDGEIANRYNTAKNDASNRKQLEAEANNFNNQQNNQAPTIDSEFKNAEIHQTAQEAINTESKEETVESGYTSTPPSNYAPVVDQTGVTNNTGIILDPEFAGAEISSYSLADITDEEWAQLIVPTEEITEGNVLIK